MHPLGHEGSTDAWTAGLVCGASAVYLLGNALFRRTTGGRWSVTHLLGVVAALAAFLLRPVVTPLTLSWVSNLVLAAVIVGDVVLARRAASRTSARGRLIGRARTTKARSSSGPGLNRELLMLAETVGFEPTEGLRLHDLSRVAH